MNCAAKQMLFPGQDYGAPFDAIKRPKSLKAKGPRSPVEISLETCHMRKWKVEFLFRGTTNPDSLQKITQQIHSYILETGSMAVLCDQYFFGIF